MEELQIELYFRNRAIGLRLEWDTTFKFLILIFFNLDIYWLDIQIM